MFMSVISSICVYMKGAAKFNLKFGGLHAVTVRMPAVQISSRHTPYSNSFELFMGLPHVPFYFPLSRALCLPVKYALCPLLRCLALCRAAGTFVRGLEPYCLTLKPMFPHATQRPAPP